MFHSDKDKSNNLSHRRIQFKSGEKHNDVICEFET